MGQNANVLFSTKFTALIKEAYMEQAKIINTTGIKFIDGTGSERYRFNRSGVLTTYEYNSGTRPADQSIRFEVVDCYYRNWVARSPVGDFDIDKMLPSEEMSVETAIKAAIGRRMDQMILDALAKCTYTNSSFTPIDINNAIEILGDGSSTATAGVYTGSEALPLSVDALLTAAEYLDDMGVPSEDRYVVVTPLGIRQLLNDNRIIDVDYNAIKALVNGEINTFMGFKFIKLGFMTEGGLPKMMFDTKVGTTAYVFHKDAIGAASSTSPKVVVWRDEDSIQWVVDGRLAAGACVIDQRGVIAIRHSAEKKVTNYKYTQPKAIENAKASNKQSEKLTKE